METNIMWSHEARLTPVVGSASEARAFVCLQLADHHLLHLVEDVRLAVSELVTNAVRHAQTPLTVTLERLPSRVRLSVHDGSPLPPTAVAARLEDCGGRGLEVVGLVSNDWGVDHGSNGDKSVWASFDVAPRAAPSFLAPV